MRSLDEVRRSDPLVRAILDGVGTAEDCVCALAAEKQALLERLLTLEMIVPRRIRAPDGTLHVWRCPESLIPISAMAPTSPYQ